MIDTVRIIISLDCNLSCSYCCNEIPEVRNRFARKALDEINFSGYQNVVITGGEPFYRKDVLFRVLRRIPPEKTIYMNTNGMLITDNDGTRDANYMQQQIITLCRGKHRTIVLDEMQSSRIPPRILETIRTIYDLGNVSFILMWTGSLRDIDMLPQFNSRVLSVYSIPGVCAKDVKLYADKYGWDITREESVRVAEVISEEEGGGGFRELDDARFKFAVWIRQKRMREGAHITYKYIRQAIEEKRIGKEKLAEGVEGGDGSAEKNAA